MIKQPSRNSIRKAKRYGKEKHKPSFIVMGTKQHNKKKHYKKQQNHFKTQVFNQPIVFNNGFLKTWNISREGSLKIGYLIENALKK